MEKLVINIKLDKVTPKEIVINILPEDGDIKIESPSKQDESPKPVVPQIEEGVDEDLQNSNY